MEKLIGLISVLTKNISRINEKVLDELRRHLPHIWDDIEKFRAQMMFENITKVIDQGKKEGLFIDYPTPIIMGILVASVRATVNPEFVVHNNFSLKQSAQTTFKIILNGILTEKGKKLFTKSFSEIEI